MILLMLIICMLLIILYHPVASIIQVASVRLTVAFIGRGPLVKGNVAPWLTMSSHFPGFSSSIFHRLDAKRPTRLAFFTTGPDIAEAGRFMVTPENSKKFKGKSAAQF